MRTYRHHTNGWGTGHSRWFLVVILGLLLVQVAPVHAQSMSNDGGSVTFSVDGGKDQLTTSIKIVLLMTVLTLAPSIVILTTSFTRILIVLGFLRQAIGTQQTPSNQILAGIALFLTVVVMMPVFEEINETAVQPYLRAQEEMQEGSEPAISEREALAAGVIPLKRFMLAQTRQKDLAMFMDFAKIEMPLEPEQLPLSVVVPSFLTSELKTAFQMGFMLYLPFLVVDMVIASVLMSMGMMMLPPILISLPFKILLFVLVDGWHLVTRSLVAAFAVSS